MRSIKYSRLDPHHDPQNRNEELHRFLLDIPYLLYFGVVPSRDAINEFLGDGGGDVGMSPSASWEAFEITETEYWQILELWDQMDLAVEIENDRFRYNPKKIRPRLRDYEHRQSPPLPEAQPGEIRVILFAVTPEFGHLREAQFSLSSSNPFSYQDRANQRAHWRASITIKPLTR